MGARRHRRRRDRPRTERGLAAGRDRSHQLDDPRVTLKENSSSSRTSPPKALDNLRNCAQVRWSCGRPPRSPPRETSTRSCRPSCISHVPGPPSTMSIAARSDDDLVAVSECADPEQLDRAAGEAEAGWPDRALARVAGHLLDRGQQIPLGSSSSRPMCLAPAARGLGVGRRRCPVPVGGEERGECGQQLVGSLLGDPVAAAGED